MFRRVGTIGVGIAVLWMASAFAGAAYGQEPRATYTDVFSTTVPGEPAGRTFTADWIDPENPGGKPHAITHILVTLHPGSQFDTSAVTRCMATDAELTSLGAAACPPDSVVGTDVLVGDTGLPDPGRYVTLDSALINGPGHVIFLAHERQSGSPHFVVRGAASGNTLDIPIPFIPGTPPEGMGLQSERGTWFNAVGPTGDAFFTTPPICPGDGLWRNRVTYTYGDGVKQTASTTTPCTEEKNPGSIRCRGKAATLSGSPDADVIRGTAGRDVIAAGGGNDRIRSRGGADVICGGEGSDRVRGGRGGDRISGGPGRDRLIGGSGDDRCGDAPKKRKRC